MVSIKDLLTTLARLSRFDRLMLAAIAILSIAILVVLWRGDRSLLQVKDFSWDSRIVSSADKKFSLQFNRPVDKASVEENLSINPPLPGKISWSGKNLFYTLSERPIYGRNYQVQLQGAKQSYGNPNSEFFVALFTTRDRAFIYIGIAGEERGRLVLLNITQQKKVILTPADLVVTDYDIYPDGNKIVFSAYEPTGRTLQENSQRLYTVTTGLNFQSGTGSQKAGRLKLLLDAKDYDNLRFAVSEGGNTLIVQRKNRRNQTDNGLWVMIDESPPRPLGIPGNDFFIAPDGKTVTVAQQGGILIEPLVAEAGGRRFLPGYAKSLGFSADSSRQFLVKDNSDFTRSLYLLERNGKSQELFKTVNPIVTCELEPRQEKVMYCLKTDLITDESGEYQEEPYLSAIDLTTGIDAPLLALPNYRDVKMSMSADGVALLFDQVIVSNANDPQAINISPNKAITDGRLWLFTLPELDGKTEISELLPEELNPGFNPKWLP